MRKSHSADTRVIAAYDALRALEPINSDPMRASQVRGSSREVPGKCLRHHAATHLRHSILICMGNSLPVCALKQHEMHRTVKLPNGDNIRANQELTSCWEVLRKDPCA